MPCRRAVRRLIPLTCCIAMVSCGDGDRLTVSPPVTSPVTIAVAGDANAAARALGRGVNFGNILEAPVEGLWGIRLNDALFDAARCVASVCTVQLHVGAAAAAATARHATDTDAVVDGVARCRC